MNPLKQKDKVLHQLILTGFVGLFFAVILIVGKAYTKWIVRSSTFKVSKIEIEGNELLSQEDILQLAGLKEGMSTWAIDLKTIEKTIDQNVFFEEVSVNRKLPDGLKIKIIEKRPVALLKIKDSFLCIDPEGLVLPSTPGKLYNLPVLSGNFKGEIGVGHLAGGSLVKEGLFFLLSVLHDRPRMYNSISEVVVGQSGGLVLYTSQFGVQVNIGNEKIDQKIRCLEAILNELTSNKELSKTQYIDLNFDGQVVVGMRT